MATATTPAEKAAPATTRVHMRRLTANVLILAAWLWLYRPVFDYLAIIFTKEDFRTSQWLLVGVVLLIISRMRAGQQHLIPASAPRLQPLPLTVAMGGSLLFLLVERFLDINTISATLFGLATYGLLGLWLEPRRWRQGLPAALLLIGTLPFGEHMQTFIGYPMRIATAAIVRDGLAAFGVTSLGIDTILILENGISQIDIPCSGVKSLWTGSLFLIAATWIERRPITLRWLFNAAVFALLLFIANLIRVAVLVVVGQVAGWRLAAEMLHIPLGALGFIGACAAAVYLLRRLPEKKPSAAAVVSAPSPRWLPPVLTLVILLFVVAYAPRPQTGLSEQSADWHFPAELSAASLPLKPDELEFLTRDGAELADRYRFEWHGYSGSMILISSRTWRAHHRPERCFEVYGLKLEEPATHLVSPSFPLRFVGLSDSSGRTSLSASYWFQSAAQTTDDYGTRMWADLAPQRQRWMLVSILFDQVVDPTDPDIQALYAALHDAVSGSLAPSTRGTSS